MDSTMEFAMEGRTAWMRVAGRATYALGPRLAEFITSCVRGRPKQLHIDLRHCVSMDSTFIGILTKNALRTDPGQLTIKLLNTPEHITEQIRGLGLCSFFRFASGALPDTGWRRLNQINPAHPDPKDQLKETMLAAHQSLAEANPENIPRFQNVIDALHRET